MSDPSEPTQTVAHDDDDRYDDDQPWEEQDALPGRPRRQLLTPLTALLFAVLVGAGAFIAGVQIEKNQLPSSGTRGAAGARFALGGATGGAAGGAAGAAGGARGGAGFAGAGGGTGGGGFAGAGGGTSGGARNGGSGAAGAGLTIGQVANVAKSALFVTDTSGNTVKVTLAPGVSVTKQISTSTKAVHPGDTVIVQGATGSDGSIAATSVRDSAGAGAGGGIGGLFGAARAGGSSAGTTTTNSGAAAGGSSGSGAGPALFGPGG
jgi:hypothetical protein